MWSRGKRPVEEVDLTLSSSPSPEPQSRPLYKPEPSQPTHTQSTHGRAAPKSTAYRPQTTPFAHKTQHRRPTAVKREPTREPQIHPEHLARIIHSSDPEALRAVLINLCKLSPALSGAVARGLKTSTFSQTLVNKYHPLPKIKAEQGTPSIKAEPSRAPSLSDSPELLSSPKIPPYVKHERQPSPAPSNGSSSGAFSDSMPLNPIKQRGNTSKSPRRVASPIRAASRCMAPVSNPSSKSAHFRVADSASRSSHLPSGSASTSRCLQSTSTQNVDIKAEPTSKSMVCRRCGDTFEDSNADAGCSFHRGEKRMTDERIVKWTCCNSGLRGPGCQFDEFHVAAHSQDMPRKRTPSYEQPSFPIRTPKNPRLF